MDDDEWEDELSTGAKLWVNARVRKMNGQEEDTYSPQYALRTFRAYKRYSKEAKLALFESAKFAIGSERQEEYLHKHTIADYEVNSAGKELEKWFKRRLSSA